MSNQCERLKEFALSQLDDMDLTDSDLYKEIKNFTCKNKDHGKGRAPSKYNIFLGECMKKKESGGKGLPMSECTTLWKESNGKKNVS